MDNGNTAPVSGQMDPLQDSSLETPVTTPAVVTPDYEKPHHGILSTQRRKKLLLINAMILAIIAVVGTVSYLFFSNTSQTPVSKSQKISNFKVSKLPVNNVKPNGLLGVGTADQLTINGQVNVGNTLVLTPTATPGKPIAGQLYYDQANNTPYYYNGTQFISLAPQAPAATGVTSLGGSNGSIGLSSGLVLSGGQLGLQLQAGNGVSISGNTITNTGVVNILAGSSNISVSKDSSGNYTIADSLIGVIQGTGTAGQLPLFTTGQSLGDSILSQSGSTITDTGNLDINGTTTLQGTTNAGVLNTGALATLNSLSVTNASTLTGLLTANGGITVTGNVTQTGAGNFTSGTGTISLQGNTSISNGKTLTVGTGLATFNGGLTVASGNLSVTTGNLNIGSGNLTVDNSGNLVTAGAVTADTVQSNSNNQLNVSAGSGVISFTAGGLNFILPTTGSGTQTICTSSTVGCAQGGGTAVILGPNQCDINNLNCVTTAQTDNSANSIFIHNNNGGNLLDLQGGSVTATPSFLVDNSGNTTIAGKLAVQSANSLTLGTSLSGTTPADGSITFQNATNNSTFTLQTGITTGNLIFTLPTSDGNPTDCLKTDGSGVLSFGVCAAGSGVTTVGTFNTGGLNNSADGATISGTSIFFQPATGTVPGMISTGSQTFAGPKTFSGDVTLNGSGTSLSVTNSATIGTGLTITSGGAIITAGDLALTGGNLTTAGTTRLSNGGALSNITGYSQSSGNFVQSGIGTFDTGTGAVNLNGNTTVASGKTLTVGGLGTFNSGLTVVSGATFTNASSTLLSSVSIANHASNSTIGSAATTVDVATTFDVTQTTSSIILTLPNPTNTASGRIVYINSLSGNANFTIYGVIIAANSSASFIWNGSAWVATSTGGTGVNSVGTLDSQTKSANGAVISGSTIYLQSADATNVGMVTATDQTFGGNKTFNGDVSIQGSGTGLAVTNNATIGGTLAVTSSATIGNGLTVTAGNLAVTGGNLTTAGTNRLTNAGALVNITGFTQSSGNFVQNGSGTFATGSGAVSLQGNTSVTGSNTFTVGTGATSLGGTLAVTGTSTLTGLLTANGGIAMAGNFVQNGSGTFATGSGAVSLQGNTSVTGSNTFTVSTGATSLGGSLAVTGSSTLSGTLSVASTAAIVGGLTVGSSTQTGTIAFVTGGGSSDAVTLKAPSSGLTSGGISLVLPNTITGTSSFTGFCLKLSSISGSVGTLGFSNCIQGSSGGTGLAAIANKDGSGAAVPVSLQPQASFDIQSYDSTSGDIIQQGPFAAGTQADLLQFQNSVGTVTGGFCPDGGELRLNQASNTFCTSSAGSGTGSPYALNIGTVAGVLPGVAFGTQAAIFTPKAGIIAFQGNSVAQGVELQAAPNVGNNAPGGGLTLDAGASTGNSSGGDIVFQVSPPDLNDLHPTYVSGVGNGAVVADNTYVWSANLHEIFRSTLSGGPVAINTVGFANLTQGIKAFAEDGTFVYYAAGSNSQAFIGRVAISSCATTNCGSPTTLYALNNTNLCTGSTASHNVSSIAVYNGLIYYTEKAGTSSCIASMPVTGGTPSLVLTTGSLLVPDNHNNPVAESNINAMTLDPVHGYFYWESNGGGFSNCLGQASVSNPTGTANPVWYCPPVTTHFGNGIATDGSYLYFDDIISNVNYIAQVALDTVTPTNQPSNLVKTLIQSKNPSALFTINNFLYWQDTTNNTVGRDLAVSGQANPYFPVMKLSGTTGAATFNNANNSDAGFQVQNASQASIFNIDTASTANLVGNGDFEAGDTTSAWTAKTTSSSNPATISQNQAFKTGIQAWQGGGTLQIGAVGNIGDGATYTPAIDTNPFDLLVDGNTYTLSMYAEIPAGSTAATVTLGYQRDGTTDTTCGSPVTLTTTWVRLTCTFTPTGSGGSANDGSNVFIKTTVAVTTTIEVDGVQLESGSNATPFNPGGAIQLNGNVESPSVFKNAFDTTTAFQIQNSAGTSNLFDADTLNSRIGIGTNAPQAKLDIQANTNNALSITQSNSSNDLLDLISGSTNVLRILGTGAATFSAAGTALTVTNAASIGTLTLGTASSTAVVLTLNGHLVTGSAAPTSPTAAASAGTSATCQVLAGNDTSGTIRVHTGSASISSGTWCTLTISFTGSPRPVISGNSSAAAGFNPFISATTTTMTFGVSNVTGVATGTDYDFNYFNAQ